MRTFTYIFFILFVFIGCSSTPNKKYDKKYLANENISFENWAKFPKLNPEILESDSHKAYINIHANDLGKEAYEKQAKLFPVGSVIFKTSF